MSVARKENGIWVVRESFGVDRYNFDNLSADSIKENIDLIVEKARKMGMIGDGRFDFDETRDWGGDYMLAIYYRFDRTENDSERKRREDIEAKAKAEAAAKRKAAAEARKLKKDAEYAEYLRLKEKFKTV